MSNKVTKYFLLFLTFILLSGCASDGWYNKQAREKFIRLSLEEREKKREKWKIDCKSFITIDACAKYTLPEPSPQEIERLKHKDSWKYKIRSWYYGIW
jgi:hypothetical protein